MGQANEMMKWQELGCQPAGDKNFCPGCVGDYALKQFIVDHAVHTDCDYCGRTFQEPNPKILEAYSQA